VKDQFGRGEKLDTNLHWGEFQVDKQTTRCPRRRVLGITCNADPDSIQGLLGGWSSFVYLPPNTKIIRLPQTLPASVFMAGGCGYGPTPNPNSCCSSTSQCRLQLGTCTCTFPEVWVNITVGLGYLQLCMQWTEPIFGSWIE
jgi:hypothetical protein